MRARLLRRKLPDSNDAPIVADFRAFQETGGVFGGPVSHTSRPIDVLVADSHPDFLEAISGAVNLYPTCRLVGAVSKGDEALELTRERRPDVLVMDVLLPDLDGLSLLEAVQREGLPTKMLVLTQIDWPGCVAEAIAIGASGYLSKMSESGAHELAAAIAAVAVGETVVPPCLHSALATAIRRKAALRTSTAQQPNGVA